MRVSKEVFNAILDMIRSRRVGVDELEARVVGVSFSREDMQRLMVTLQAMDLVAPPTMVDALDVQYDDNASRRGTIRVSISQLSTIQAALDGGLAKAALQDAAVPPIVIRKAPVMPSVHVAEYGIRVNLKEEVQLKQAEAENVLGRLRTALHKTFRYKRRFTYRLSPQYRVDLTSVRQLRAGAAVPTYHDIMACPETYEVEVELEPTVVLSSPDGRDVDAVAKELLRHCNVLLKVIHDTQVLLSASEQHGVVREYSTVALGRAVPDAALSATEEGSRLRAKLFMGPKPVTLNVSHLLQPACQPQQPEHADALDDTNTQRQPHEAMDCVRHGYTVTDKADGERRLLYVGINGRSYMLDDRMNVRDTGLPPVTDAAVKGSVLDGEFIAQHMLFMVFDAYTLGGVDVRCLPLMVASASGSELRHATRPHPQPQPPPQPPKRRQAARGGGGSVGPASRLDAAHTVADALAACCATGGRRSSGTQGPGPVFVVKVKEFFPIQGGNDLFTQCKRVLAKSRTGLLPYHMDGLIFTPMDLPVGAGRGQPASGCSPAALPVGGRWSAVMKWKPPEQNTIDFLVRFHPDNEVVLPQGGPPHAVADLLVGQNAADARKERRLTLLDWVSGQHEPLRRGDGKEYVAVPFSAPGRPWCNSGSTPGSDDVGEAASQVLHVVHLPHAPAASQAQTHAQTRILCENGDEVVDNTVVEFRFDATPSGCDRPIERRWVPLRARKDKTEQYRRTGVVTANNMATARGVWDTIVHPVTEETLTHADVIDKLALPNSLSMHDQGAEVGDTYYISGLPRGEGDTQPMRKFHNWVKRDVLLMPLGRLRAVKALADLGVGRAGDLQKWLDMPGLQRVLGIDKVAANLTEAQSGAYARTMGARARWKKPQPFPSIVYVALDMARPISSATINTMDDTAGSRSLANVLWGHVPRSSVANARLRSLHGFAQGGFDAVSCMFAIHYVFDNRDHLHTFCQNVSGLLRPGGMFVGCCLDSRKVRELLAGKQVGSSVDGACREGDSRSCGWRIIKRYDDSPGAEAANDVFGQRIDVFMESIGQTLAEFLVDYDTLVHAMAQHGLLPASQSMAATLDLPGHGATGLFDACFQRMTERRAPGGQHAGDMSPSLQKYSFLNRWFVFVKRESSGGSIPAVIGA